MEEIDHRGIGEGDAEEHSSVLIDDHLGAAGVAVGPKAGALDTHVGLDSAYREAVRTGFGFCPRARP